MGVWRGWALPAVVGMVLGAAGCGGHSQSLPPGSEGHRAPSASRAAAQTPSGSAASAKTVRPVSPGGPALAGSFLMDMTWVGDQRGWALAAAPCAGGLCPRVAATGDGGRTWTALPVPPRLIHGESGTGDC